MKQVDLSVDKGRKNGMHITNSYRDQVELLPANGDPSIIEHQVVTQISIVYDLSNEHNEINVR